MNHDAGEAGGFFGTIIANITEGICLVRASDALIVYANPRFERMFGYRSGELEGMPMSAVIYEDDRVKADDVARGIIEQLSRSGEAVYEVQNVRKDGTPFWCRAHTSFVNDPVHGGVWLAIHEDISERKRSEIRIAFLNRVVSTVSEINQLIVRERDGGRLLREACRIATEHGGFEKAWICLVDETTGAVRPVAVSGMQIEKLACPGILLDDLAREEQSPTTAVDNRPACPVIDPEPDVVGCRLCLHARDRAYPSAVSFPLTVEGGAVGGFSAVAGDPGVFEGEILTLLRQLAGDIGYALEKLATEKRHSQAEAALRESEERFRKLAESSFAGIAVQEGGQIIEASQSFAELFGYELSELVGKSITDLAAPESVPLVLEKIRGGVEQPYEAVGLKKDGTHFYGELFGRAIPYHGRVARITAIRDITQRKKTEEALQLSEDKYRRFFEQDLAGNYVSTPDGRLVACNPAFARMFGFDSPSDALTSNLEELYPSREARDDFLDILMKRGRLEYHQAELRRRDGRPIYVVETAVAIHDGLGKLIEIQGYLIDESERRQAEEQLRQSQKMEAVGRLAGGIAHDFNNLLTAILGYSSLLSTQLGEQHPLGPQVVEIRKAAERAAELTRQLLVFGRKQVLLPKLVFLNDIVSNVDRMLRRIIGEDIELNLVLETDLGRVTADPGQIEQIILNLAVNARDAMPDGGRLTIETHNVELDEAYALDHASVRPGPYVVLIVADTGVGMEPETLSRIFEPFFTTKEIGKGTGLGLATAYGIVQQSGGHIWVYSEPGKGATFKVYLPRVGIGDESEAGLEPDAVEDIPRGTETVLLVEDDEGVRSLLRSILVGCGYEVLDAPNGEAALEQCAIRTDKLHLVITDVVMPGMSGPEFAAAMATRFRGIKILFISGYTDDHVVRNRILHSKAAFLQKPFTPDGLAKKVRAILDEPNT
ncbi:MAG: PAS domain S-box protein [Acidobacteria bacterium]|nr:PAS domain S-box protein [Acidobacteriota bacterium]